MFVIVLVLSKIFGAEADIVKTEGQKGLFKLIQAKYETNSLVELGFTTEKKLQFSYPLQLSIGSILNFIILP